jgi:hypothetical protein
MPKLVFRAASSAEGGFEILPGRTVVLAAFLLFAALARPARAEEPGREIYECYHEILVRYGEDLEAAEARYRPQFVGKLFDGDGKPRTEEWILSGIKECRATVAGDLKVLDDAFKQVRERTASLAWFVERGNAAMWSSGKEISRASIDETTLLVSRISQEQSAKSREIERAYQDKVAALSTKDRDAYDKAVALAKEEARIKEGPVIEKAVKDWEAARDSFLERRRVLAGDLWRLVDFHERRERKDDVAYFLDSVYRIHSYGHPKNSQLDFFVSFPGSKDRLIVYQYFHPEIEGLHKIAYALPDQPVESLRQFDTTLPDLTFTGTPLEQLAKRLSARMLRFYSLQARSKADFEKLESLRAVLEALPETSPDLSELAKAVETFPKSFAFEEEQEAARAAAQKKFDAADLAVDKAQRDLDAARGDLWMNEKSEVVKDSKVKNAERASKRMDAVRKQIADAEKLAADETLDDETRRKYREIQVPQLKDKLAKMEAAATAACAGKQKDLEDARARLEEARRELAAAPKQGKNVADEKWQQVRDLYRAARQALPGKEGEGLVELPEKGDAAAGKLAAEMLEKLMARVADLDARRDSARKELQELFGQWCREEREIKQLAVDIEKLKIEAATSARTALKELGARPDDQVIKDLEAYCEKLKKVSDLLSKAGSDPDDLQKSALSPALSALRDRMGSLGRILKYVHVPAQVAITLKKAQDGLGDERQGIRAMFDLIKLAGDGADELPGMGPTIGKAISFYADTGRECAEAALRIQDKLIETNLKTLFSQPPPERHLYTLEEVTAGSSLENEGANKRIATMLQARRLVGLTWATSEAEARDMTR